jgi:hypothetical protein
MRAQVVVCRGKRAVPIDRLSVRPKQRLAAGLAAAIGEIAFPALLAILVGALYWKAASAGIWLTAVSFIGIFLLASSKMRLRAIDVCVALILLYELPSAQRLPPV